MAVAFAPGTAELRGLVADELVARIGDIVEQVDRITAGRDSMPDDPAARQTIEDDQRVDTAQGTRLVARWIATGEVPGADELARLAGTGRRVARNTGPFSRVVRANLAWRDAVAAVIDDAVGRGGGSPAMAEGLRVGAEIGCDANLMRTAREFDEQRRAIEMALAAKERDLAYQALHDPLTGLANRTLLFDRLRRLRPPSGRSGAPAPPAVVFIDLDGFKEVNDVYGHAGGDAVLVALARRMANAVRPQDTVARLGGDEFVVLCEAVPDATWAVTLAHRILGVLADPVQCGVDTVQVGASVGVAVGDGDPFDPDRLVIEADSAMYQAKQIGRGAVVVAGQPS